MIVKRVWLQQRGPVEWKRDGWYLLGFLPVYIRDLGPRARRK